MMLRKFWYPSSAIISSTSLDEQAVKQANRLIL
jgi:hypothetical protein